MLNELERLLHDRERVSIIVSCESVSIPAVIATFQTAGVKIRLNESM
jgi:hypothetical protein